MAPAAKAVECLCPADTIHPTPFDANFLSETALKCDDLPDLAKPDASGSPFVLEGVTYDGDQLSITATTTSAEECRKACLFQATGDAADEQVAFSWNSENDACSCHGDGVGALGVATDGKKIQTGIVCYKDGEECTDTQTSLCYKKPTAATASAMKKQVAQRRVAEAETELRKAQARRPTMSLVCFSRLATASHSICPPCHCRRSWLLSRRVKPSRRRPSLPNWPPSRSVGQTNRPRAGSPASPKRRYL